MLYSSTYGTGEDLVLLHGWGFSGNIFDKFIEKYKDLYRITTIDLPGHGNSKSLDSISSWSKEIAKIIPKNSILIGWSLGGLIAIDIASRVKLRKIILVASTPKFVQSEDWIYGINEKHFYDFHSSLSSNPQKTLKRFISLQVSSKDQYKYLEASIDNNKPTDRGLNEGLDYLLKYDFRNLIEQIADITKVYLGEKDTLVPSSIKSWYEKKGIQVAILSGGHIPFLDDNFEI